MLETIRRLVHHLGWADERVLTALRASAAPATGALAVYAHLIAAEHVWLCRLRGETPRLPVWPTLSLDECASIGADNVSLLEELLNGLTEADLPREVAYRTGAGDAFASRTDDILLHVALHGSYHRGQVALMLRQGGAEPLPTDYIVFVRGTPGAVAGRIEQGERTRFLGYDE